MLSAVLLVFVGSLLFILYRVTDLYLLQLYKVHNIMRNFDDTVLLHSTTGLADIFSYCGT